MPINTRNDYIEIGTSVNKDYSLNNELVFPAPNELPFSNEFVVEAERNANATLLIQQIGRTQYTTQVKWAALTNKKWWALNRWFDTYGYVFYLKYFNHADGKVKIQRFYRGNIEKATPSPDTEIINGILVPKKYYNCGFSIIDMGEDEIITIQEMSVSG